MYASIFFRTSGAPALSRTSRRLPAFDALRAAGVLAGILPHSAAAYMRVPMPDLLWTVQDTTTSVVLDYVFWYGRLVQPPLFFFLSGFFCADLLASRSIGEFLAQRWRRVARPLLLGGLIVLPLTYYVWAAGWLVAGRCDVDDILRLRFAEDIQRNVYGPAHLWFLQDLCIVSLGAAVMAFMRTKLSDPRRAPQRVQRGPWGVLTFALPATVLLAWDVGPVLAHPNTFFPDPLRPAYGAIYFAGGTWLYTMRARLTDFAAYGGLLVGLSLLGPLVVVATLARTPLGQLSWREGALLAATISLTAWLAIVGSLGLALRHAHRIGGRVRYLAESSLWLYIVHLPIVGLVQVDLYTLPLPAGVKFIGAAGSGLGLGLLSFELARRRGRVRRSPAFLGARGDA